MNTHYVFAIFLFAVGASLVAHCIAKQIEFDKKFLLGDTPLVAEWLIVFPFAGGFIFLSLIALFYH